MADKDRIRQEIESYKESMKGLEPHSDFRRGQITAYNHILQFIDSLPEEPTVKGITWEDVNTLHILIEEVRHEFPNGIGEKSFGLAVLEKFQDCQDAIEEPSSEVLEEVAYNYATQHNELLGFDCDCEPIQTGPELKKAVIFGAEWQKQQMTKDTISCKKLYDAIKENQEKKSFNDDFEKASYAQGMIDGSIWQKQQMMKDAVECVVEDWCGNSPEITIPLNPQDFKNGDEVKIIIVKEEKK